MKKTHIHAAQPFLWTQERKYLIFLCAYSRSLLCQHVINRQLVGILSLAELSVCSFSLIIKIFIFKRLKSSAFNFISHYITAANINVSPSTSWTTDRDQILPPFIRIKLIFFNFDVEVRSTSYSSNRKQKETWASLCPSRSHPRKIDVSRVICGALSLQDPGFQFPSSKIPPTT